MGHRGDFCSPVSNRKSERYPTNENVLSADSFNEKMFSEDQIKEIEDLLSRIGDDTDGHEMVANNFECGHVSSVNGGVVTHKKFEEDNVLSDRPRCRDTDKKRERIWKAHVANVHTHLEQKKSDITKAILNERRFRKKNREQRYWHRAQFHIQTPKLLPLRDEFLKYDIQADDLTMFVEMRTR
ncbi:unspecified product [Leishmania tarentolae]|uniref:Unspecified product n=1 Tax=Leishmania tarentolae TaxID=5689 RepID=A0A640KJD1_LEITA|nr:unspecified product [Leishmania tarentolae]